jgi:DNA-binding MarR family transcriptional regulator
VCTTPDGAPCLVYATLPASTMPEAGADDPLSALLGTTRAAILRLLAQPHSTTGIAQELHISLANASEHTKILRTAGLIVTQRNRSAVSHSRTALGHRLAHN